MAKRQPLPSQEVLLKLLRYDKATGKLYWNTRPLEFFTAEGHTAAHSRAKWNSRWAGKEALTKINIGYRCGRLLYQYVLAHRVIWKMVTGQEPVEIDHISGNRADNRWDNLRDVDTATNRKNSARRSDNTSGQVGVYWDKSHDCWCASIQSANRVVYLGKFNSFDEAVAARKAAEPEHGFHPNHGRTALA